MKTTSINNLKEGKLVFGFFICKRFNLKVSRLGDPFIDLLFEDSTGIVRAKIWSFVDQYQNKISIDEPFAVKGKVVSFNQSLEIDVHHISSVEKNLYDKYGYKKQLLFPKVNESIDELFSRLNQIIDSIDHKCKKNIKIFFKKNKSKVSTIQSIDKKYSLIGGFLSQTISVLELNKNLFSKYTYDYNIVCLAIMLRNIGLIECSSEDFNKNNNEDIIKKYNVFTLNILNENFKKFDDIYLFIHNLIFNNNSMHHKEMYIVKYLFELDSILSD